MMKSLLSREFLLGLIFVAFWTAAAVIIAYPLADKSLGRSFLMVAMSVAAMLFGVARSSPRARLLYHRVRFYAFGPTYKVSVAGVFRTSAPGEDKVLLEVGTSVAKKVYGTTRVLPPLTNRVAIRANDSTTIQITLPQEPEHEHEPDDPIDLAFETGRLVEVELWGYDTNARRITKVMEREIVPFLSGMVDALQAETLGRSFSLNITLPSKNPFLRFYLKDVPDADVNKFQLEFSQKVAGDYARVVVRENGFSVSAFAPQPFTRIVRTYLSTPALAHSEGD